MPFYKSCTTINFLKAVPVSIHQSIKFAASLSAALALSGCGSDAPEHSISRSASSSARQVLGLSPVIADKGRLGSGIDHVAALHTNGSVFAWGGNQYGQLGQGNTKSSLAPVAVKGLSSVTEVQAGGFHMAAIRSDRSVWSWGNNSYGQVGVGGLSAVSAMPRKVPGLSEVRSVAAGYVHTSAVGFGGAVWNWGQMPGRASSTPAKVWGIVKPMTSVAAGSDFTLALANDGMVYGWGGNARGQIGVGYISPNVLNPVALPGLTNVRSLAAGHAHALALRSDGTVWAWGSNQYGQLSTTGDNTRARPVVGLPTPMAANGVRAVFAGAFNSAVLYADGSVWMWGLNATGQFGNGSTEGSTVPVKINTLPNVAAVTIGQWNVSVLKKDGTVYSMGGNSSGQLGNNTQVNSSTPVQVVGLSGVGYLNVGASHLP